MSRLADDGFPFVGEIVIDSVGPQKRTEVTTGQVLFLKSCQLLEGLVHHLDHSVFIQKAEAFRHIVKYHLCNLFHVQGVAQLLVGEL